MKKSKLLNPMIKESCNWVFKFNFRKKCYSTFLKLPILKFVKHSFTSKTKWKKFYIFSICYSRVISSIRINISHNIRISLHQHIFNINWAQSLFTRVFRPYKRRLISVRHESKIIRSDLIVSFTTIRIYNLS